MHREREGLVKERTALINRIRSTLGEFGIAIPSGPQRLKRWFRESYGEYEYDLPDLMKRHIQRMRIRLLQLEGDVEMLDREIDLHGKYNPEIKRLKEVPGIGRLTASALVASIGDGKAFKSGRQFASWLGLVPKQHASGGKQKLLGIGKRGDSYLRRMLIHGSRSVLRHLNPKRSVTPWLKNLLSRAHPNVVIVALANKLARIAWALLTKKQLYQEVLI